MAKRKFSGKRKEEKASKVMVMAYKFCGYPSEETEHLLWRNINHCRGFWNLLVEGWKNKTLATDSPAWHKQQKETSWLKEADSLALANVQINYQKALDTMKAGDCGKLRHKKKGVCRSSYTTNCSNKKKPNLFLEGEYLHLPKMKEAIRLNLHRSVKAGGVLKRCTVSYYDNQWYFSLSFEYPKDVVSCVIDKNARHIGLDMSLPHLYTDSEGREPEFLHPYRKAEKRLAREQRKLSHMVKDSSNYKKQKAKLVHLHARTKHVREDFLHKLSYKLTEEYDVISIENLDMAAMRKSLKFGKSVSDIGWGNFTRMLAYKQERKGHTLIKIDKWYPSSKTCSSCGYVHKELKLSDRTYVCPYCGAVMDRDANAAINIDRIGFAQYLNVISHTA